MYSLVVYNNKNHEKIIIDRTKFDKLYKIDCLTARFKDKEEFVKFLISSELIKEEDVRIYIHYKYKGDKYLPIIYNNIDLLFYIVQTDRNKLEESVDFNYFTEFYNKLVNYMRDLDFITALQQFQLSPTGKYNGDYLSSTFFEVLMEYNYAVNISKVNDNEHLNYIADLEHQIRKHLEGYKNFRILAKIISKYEKLKFGKEFSLIELEKEQETELRREVPELMKTLNDNGGMDDVYSIFDYEEVEQYKKVL